MRGCARRNLRGDDFEAISAALNGQEGQWAGVAVPGDAVTDEQALVNGYMKIVEYESGAKLPMVAVPARVNGDRPELRRAPTLGEHTDEVIAALGRTEAQIMELKIAGVIS